MLMLKRTSVQWKSWRKDISLLLAILMVGSLCLIHPQGVNAASTVTIDTNFVVSSDFLGVGTQWEPMVDQYPSEMLGYSDAYWEVEKSRIKRLGLKVSRVRIIPGWYMSDWYTYTWTSNDMNAFYKFMDFTNSNGIEVELNVCWKTARNMVSWWGSAVIPNSYIDFARSVSDLLDQLINAKGYSNIKYLAFFNEPNFNITMDSYKNILVAVHDKLVTDGRRNLVEIWGPEATMGNTAVLWTEYMVNNANQVFDRYSFHGYTSGTADYYKTETGKHRAKTEPVGKTVTMTEFGRTGTDGRYSYRITHDYGKWVANAIVNAMKDKAKTTFLWSMSDMPGYDPHEFMANTTNYLQPGWLHWGNYAWMPYDLNPRPSVYSYSLLTRYIPRHSDVISSSCSDIDLNVTSVKSNGEYSIVLVNNSTLAKSVTCDFNGVNINKSMGRHIYDSSTLVEDNALLPARDATFLVTTSFTDGNVPAGSVLVYTTLAEELQVEVKPNNRNIMPGDKLQFSANIIGGSGGVTWSVVGNGNGSIDSNGLYTAPVPTENDTYRTIAVKATSTTDNTKYGIGLIRVGYDNMAKRKAVTASSSDNTTTDPRQWEYRLLVDDCATSRIGEGISDYGNGYRSSSSLTANHTEWVKVDLGAENVVNWVYLYPWNDLNVVGEGFPVDFTIQVSKDDINWETVTTLTGCAKPGDAPQIFEFPGKQARYVKVDATSLRPYNGEYRLVLAEMEVYGTNLAEGKTVTASSSGEDTYGWGKNYAVDGIRYTDATGGQYERAIGYHSDSNLTQNHTEWYKVDLGATSTVGEVNIYPRNDAGYVGMCFPVDFQIQVSTDDVNWTTIVDKSGYPLPGNENQRFDFPAVQARYVRLFAASLRQNQSGEYRLVFSEFEVNRGDLNAGGTASASSSYETAPFALQNAFDGVRTSSASNAGWKSNSDFFNNHTEWLKVDWGRNCQVSRVLLYPRGDAPYTGNGYPVDFTIDVSSDNTNWTTAVKVVNCAKPITGDPIAYTFSPRTARYIRVNATNLSQQTDGKYTCVIAEFEAYEK